jgi:hypothetical protein
MNALAPIRRGSEKRSFGNGDMSDPFPIPRGNGARYGRAPAQPMPAIRFVLEDGVHYLDRQPRRKRAGVTCWRTSLTELTAFRLLAILSLRRPPDFPRVLPGPGDVLPRRRTATSPYLKSKHASVRSFRT